MKNYKLGSSPDAIGDAIAQSLQIQNRRYGLIEKMVDHVIRHDYDQEDYRLHEQIVFFYNLLLTRNCISVDVCYGIDNRMHSWSESLWLHETDCDQRLFTIGVAHSQISPPQSSLDKEVTIEEYLRFANSSIDSDGYTHPAFKEDIRQMFKVFIQLLFPNYVILIEMTPNGWLRLIAREKTGKNVVTITSRCFAAASIESFNISQSGKAYGFSDEEITYN